jgi:G6PDH family F420-dependent oxidoreductase
LPSIGAFARTRAKDNASTANVAASTASTAGAPTKAMSRPARTGPATVDASAITVSSALAGRCRSLGRTCATNVYRPAEPHALSSADRASSSTYRPIDSAPAAARIGIAPRKTARSAPSRAARCAPLRPRQRDRADRTRQSVGGDRQPDPQAARMPRRQLQCQPAHRDGAHAVTERRQAEARQHPSEDRVPDHRPIGRHRSILPWMLRILQERSGLRKHRRAGYLPAMVNFGYTLMCEQTGPSELVDYAVRAEEAGYDFAAISDHYNPWLTEQGHSPFAWSVLGAVAYATQSLELMTMVTCPTRRYHPAVVAQQAATIGVMSQGRFTLGIGAGENLNEHVAGSWPHRTQRHEMLAEAMEIINPLLDGETVRHSGTYFDVPEARLWDLPDDGVPVALAVSGPESLEIAAENADAVVAAQPDRSLHIDGKPLYGQVAVCYGPDEAECRKRALDQWRWFGLQWPVLAELPDPRAFDAAASFATEDDVARSVPCGPDVDKHVEAVRAFVDAGFTHIALVQIGGSHQQEFLDWSQSTLLPALHAARA